MENLLEAIIHAFVTTNLDYCNAILYGLPKVLLNHLTFTKKYEHIIPSLTDLHWLPFEYHLFRKSYCWYIRLSMDFHQVIYPISAINSVFVAAPTICVLARISYFKSRDLS